MPDEPRRLNKPVELRGGFEPDQDQPAPWLELKRDGLPAINVVPGPPPRASDGAKHERG